MPEVGSVITAMMTPFDTDGAVDFAQVDRLARYLVSHGSDSLLVTGTTGESPTLSHDEKLALYRTVVDAVGDRAAVIAGTGTYDTAESVELSRSAADLGCHALLAVTPYYSKPGQAMLEAHFTAIADSTDLPVILYNIPGRTSRLIEVATLANLAKHPRIVAVKDAVEDVGFTMRTRAATPADFTIYSGSDYITLPMMAVGAVGVVSVASHLVGPQVKRMVEAAASGDLVEARRLHFELLPTFDALFLEPNPTPLKGAMNELWEPMGPPRLPLLAPQPETVQRVVEAVGKAQAL